MANGRWRTITECSLIIRRARLSISLLWTALFSMTVTGHSGILAWSKERARQLTPKVGNIISISVLWLHLRKKLIGFLLELSEAIRTAEGDDLAFVGECVLRFNRLVTDRTSAVEWLGGRFT